MGTVRVGTGTGTLFLNKPALSVSKLFSKLLSELVSEISELPVVVSELISEKKSELYSELDSIAVVLAGTGTSLIRISVKTRRM